ncbi:MAG TPA: hypothetical protein VFB06_36240 [Streptosporangiaceae bacterium]|nr:hypothetical protein [Streptosporangiaceae bacterium]
MTPPLVLRPRPAQQPLLVGFVILLVLSVVLPLAGFGTDSFGDAGAWIAFGLACLVVGRPLRSRIVVSQAPAMSLDNATFSDVTALFVWNRYLGVRDAEGITIVRLRARWTAGQLDRLAAALGVPLTVHRDGIPKAATGPRMMADLAASGADVSGADVVVRDLGKHEADVSRLMRLLSYTYLTPDPGTPPRVRLRDASSAEVSRAAAALLDAGAQIRLERPRARR